MEDLQSYKIDINSSLHNYSVEFSNDFCSSIIKEGNKGDVIILDKNVFKRYKNKIKKLSEFKIILIEASENQKSYYGVIPTIQELINCNFKKNNKLISVGGGITQDIALFISSIIYRGVDCIFYPTTLLAQSDSCIGGKTSINFNGVKNQIGGFYPPKKIIIDTGFLKTLTEDDYISGIGEMAHYFFVSGYDDFLFFKENYKNKKMIDNLIFRSLAIKKKFIEIDELDKKERQLLNYGHSFGHAIESLTNYTVPHGIAVSHGMNISNFISYNLGFASIDFFKESSIILNDIAKSNAFSFKNVNVENFIEILKKDKKNINNQLGLILTKGYGEMFKHFVNPDNQFVKMLENYKL